MIRFTMTEWFNMPASFRDRFIIETAFFTREPSEELRAEFSEYQEKITKYKFGNMPNGNQ